MNSVQKTQPRPINRGATLILMQMGIGDAVVVGLSAIDQIIRNETLCSPRRYPATSFDHIPQAVQVSVATTIAHYKYSPGTRTY